MLTHSDYGDLFYDINHAIYVKNLSVAFKVLGSLSSRNLIYEHNPLPTQLVGRVAIFWGI